MQKADRALYETGVRFQYQRMELYQANQRTAQTQREKSWLCNEMDRKIVQDVAKNLKHCEESALQKLREPDT